MGEHGSLMALLNQFWLKISARRKMQFGALLVLMVITSFAEVISIGAALPFLAALTDPDRLFQTTAIQPLIRIFDLSKPLQLILPLTILFGFAAVLAGAMRLLMLWVSTRLAFAAGADLSMDIYRRTLYQPYEVHCARNSSEVINGISTKANGVIYNMILPVLTLISSIVVMIAILIALFFVQPVVALAAFFGFGLIYLSIIFITRKQLLIDSELIARESSAVIKSLQEGLGGIRDVLIDGSQAAYCKIYRDADLPLRRAQGNNQFIAQSPRYALEALGMLLIAFLAFALSQSNHGVASAIPILGALALGAQRLLPVLQQAYSSWINVSGTQVSLGDILKFLDQPLPAYADDFDLQSMPFKKEISLSRLYFRYRPETSWVLKDLNLTIKKGSRVGFVGTTGSGKSTLLDIVMGLLQPSQGELKIDGTVLTLKNQRSWQTHIAHVPQTIFLADSTVEENIAFGIPKGQINFDKVRDAAKKAQIAHVIDGLPEGYQTHVGERGVRLSGGQRQRIGIARALYKDADVIIFDEATSALDGETEEAVMEAIEGLSKDLTILVIAHRLSTLKTCTQVVDLENGSIKRIGSYVDIALSPPTN
jgi:ATP-binding cassette, subfamily B, bacterial PglK